MLPLHALRLTTDGVNQLASACQQLTHLRVRGTWLSLAVTEQPHLGRHVPNWYVCASITLFVMQAVSSRAPCQWGLSAAESHT
jgi:hypothetical protein